MKSSRQACLAAGWAAAWLLAGPACAQIRTDASLGRAPQAIAGPQFVIPESLGALRGANLFHSFSVFGIGSGESATFTTSTLGIANVISRVTGGEPSVINGLLRLSAAGGTPGFFFINPAGVTFGAGASVDVPGAFHVTTADYVKFADGKFFADASASSTLSSAPPEAFGFLGSRRASVDVIGGARLTAAFMQPFSIVAGDITLDNGRVATVGGDIRIVALGAAPAEVPLAGTLPAASGTLRVVNGGEISAPASGAQDGGHVSVSAGDILISRGASAVATGLFSQANTGTTGNAGGIDVLASGSVRVLDGGVISSSTFTSGNAGAVHVQAGAITLDSRGNSVLTGIFSNASSGATGNAGPIDIGTAGLLEVLNGAEIASNAFSHALNAGDITIRAGDLVIDRLSGPLTGIFSRADIASTGHAGAIDVGVSGTLAIVGGEISSSTFSIGNAGNVRIRATDLRIDRNGGPVATGIFSQAEAGSSGRAGTVDVAASGLIELTNGARLSSSTFGSGNAGSIDVRARDIVLDGGGFTRDLTSIASTAETGSTGHAGTVTVVATGALSILNGAEISSSTFSTGDASSVNVSADRLLVDSQGFSTWGTGIYSAADGSTGNAGSVDVTARELTLRSGEIGSNTFGRGNAGLVSIRAGDITVDGGDSGYAAILSSAQRGSSGRAGSVDITATGTIVLLDGGEIASSTFSTGNAGTVRVAARNVTIDGRASGYTTGIFSQANDGTGNAGNVSVSVSGALGIFANGFISSSTSTSGIAGSVSVDAGSLLIDAGGSSAGVYSSANDGSTGRAGTVDVKVAESLIMRDYAQISSTTFGAGSAGNVRVSAGDIFIDGNGNPTSYTGITSNTDVGSTGNAGIVEVTAVRTLTLTAGAEIASSTFSRGNAGSVSVRAGGLVIDGVGKCPPCTGIISQAEAQSFGNAGVVTVDVSGMLTLLNGGYISSATSSPTGNGGAVSVHAGDILIDQHSGPASTTINAQANRNTIGRGGSVDVRADGSLVIRNGGFISASTFGDGDAGNAVVRADSIFIDRGTDIASGRLTGITSQTNGGAGNAGGVDVAARIIQLVRGGEISSSTFSAGNAGPVKVAAVSLSADGGDTFAPTGVFSRAESASTGQAGKIEIVATDVSLLNGATISSTSFGEGSAGSITVRAASIRADGGGSEQQTGILSEATGFTGNAGTIDVVATGDIVLARGGAISSDSSTDGRAGSVSVAAGNITVTGGDHTTTGILSRAGYYSAGAGTIDVRVSETLRLASGGTISSSTDSFLGAAGSVHVVARDIVVDGRNAFDQASTINARANTYSAGQTGNVTVEAARSLVLSNGGELSITNDAQFYADAALVRPTLLSVSAPLIDLRDGGAITAASTGSVAASNIAINVGQRLFLDNASITTSAVDGNGGSITVTGEGAVALRNSQITTSVTGLVGNGGDITIATRALVMDTGFIQANTAASDAAGGNVNIDVSSLIPSGNSVFVGGSEPLEFRPGIFGLNVIQAAAPTGVSGAIAITTPSLDISAGLTALNARVLESAGLGRGLCDVTGGSSLAQAGRGGLPPSARGFLRDDDVDLAARVALARVTTTPASIACWR